MHSSKPTFHLLLFPFSALPPMFYLRPPASSFARATPCSLCHPLEEPRPLSACTEGPLCSAAIATQDFDIEFVSPPTLAAHQVGLGLSLSLSLFLSLSLSLFLSLSLSLSLCMHAIVSARCMHSNASARALRYAPCMCDAPPSTSSK